MISEKYIQAEKLASSNAKNKYFFDNEQLLVEQLAQKKYEKEGFKSLWSENDYWWAIFALLFWDIIFAKIDGVWSPIFKEFPSKHQDMPIDFFTNEFYVRRKSLFDNKIKELSHTDIKQRFCISYKEHFHKPCRLIENWRKFSLADYLVAVEKIENDKLLKILERLAKDFTNNRSGLPDLFVYSESKNEYFFAEVKSEKDKISEKQRFWHSFLSDELGCKIEIIMVNNNGNKINKKLRSKNVNIFFGKSTSKNYEEAVNLIKKQPGFNQYQENNDITYSATFDIADIEKLYKILDLTNGWKTQKILIDGKIWKSSDLREALGCFRKKELEKNSLDYCLTNGWDGEKNKFRCRNFYFHELENDFWNNYGYIDTQKEEWIFKKKLIQEVAEKQINKLILCPLFNKKWILSLLQAIPETINPKKDTDWGFIDNDRNIWFWKKNTWFSQWNNDPFPGISMMVGVKKLEKNNFCELEYNSTLNINREELLHIVNKKTSKKAWYKTCVGIILIFFLYPILVPYLVWTKTKWHKLIKIAITAIIIMIFIQMIK